MVFDDGAASQYYVLPNVADYSKYSVVRNHVYDINVRYSGAQLMLKYKVLPWDNGGNSGVYVMDAFNVYTADPAFKGQLTNIVLSTTTQHLATGETIELKPESGFSFEQNGTPISGNVVYGATAQERGFRNYRIIQVKANSYPVAGGTPVFGVYSNGKLVYTVKAVA